MYTLLLAPGLHTTTTSQEEHIRNIGRLALIAFALNCMSQIDPSIQGLATITGAIVILGLITYPWWGD